MKISIRSALLGVLIMTILGALPTDVRSASFSRAEVAHQAASEVTTIIDRVASSAGLPNVLLISRRSADNSIGYPPQYSLDGGATWHEVATTPWPNNSQLSIALSPRPDQSVRIIVGAGEVLYRTGDYGVNWAQQALNSPYNPLVTSLIASPASPTLLYASSYNFTPWVMDTHGYASDDAGVSWRWTVSNYDIIGAPDLRFVPSPLIARRVYVRLLYAGELMSDDAGASWITMTVPGSGNVALDAQNASWLYSYSPYDAPPAGYRSTDGGANWTPWALVPQNCNSLMAHPTQSQTLFLTCQDGLYRSSNGGDDWQQILCTPYSLLAPDYGVPGRLLFAYAGGLWGSLNEGTTWTPIIPAEGVRLYCHTAFAPFVAHENQSINQSAFLDISRRENSP